jgi:hypothetical protein
LYICILKQTRRQIFVAMSNVLEVIAVIIELRSKLSKAPNICWLPTVGINTLDNRDLVKGFKWAPWTKTRS